MKTLRLPEMPVRETAAMRTVLMARRPVLPMETAAALAKVAEAASRFAANEARVCVRMLLLALDVGALESAKRYVEAYVQRIRFIGEPAADVQKALRADITVAYVRMPPERRRQFDELVSDVRRRHPKAWIVSVI